MRLQRIWGSKNLRFRMGVGASILDSFILKSQALCRILGFRSLDPQTQCRILDYQVLMTLFASRLGVRRQVEAFQKNRSALASSMQDRSRCKRERNTWHS